jgi:hypothetical protein
MDLNQDQVKQLAKRSQRERLELEFHEAWIDEFGAALGPLERQFRHNHRRRWRWDFRIGNVLIDIQGGTFIRGAHSRGVGQDKDFEKWNDAIRHGFRPLLFGTLAMKDPIACVTLTAEILTNAREITDSQRGVG